MGNFPYDDPVEPNSVGMNSRKLNQAVSEFKNQHSKGAFPGGQLVVRRQGKLVINEVCGMGRGWRKEEGITPLQVQPDTPFVALSAGKPIAAVAIAMLEERGVLEVETPVAEWIPGFDIHGKGEITILDVLTHQTGLTLPDLVASREIWHDREAILQQLIEAKPIYPRGTKAYAAFEYGWLLSEIVWRAVGLSLTDFISDEISTPLQLPALQYGLAGRDPDSVAYSYWLGGEKVVVSGINVAEGFEENNNSLVQINSMNPAVSLVADAASLAGFYEFLVQGGGTQSGERLISEEIIGKYTALNVSGIDRSSRMPGSFGRGFMVGSRFLSLFGWWGTEACFGHAGGFSCLGFGDHETGIAVGIMTNGNRDFFDLLRRFLPLSQKLRNSCTGAVRRSFVS